MLSLLSRFRSGTGLALAAIVVLAFGLRGFGIQYGLPAVYNPDEVAIMARALSFAKGTLNPHNFLYPTLYFYVLFGWVGTYLGAVWLAGGVSTVGELHTVLHESTGLSQPGPARSRLWYRGRFAVYYSGRGCSTGAWASARRCSSLSLPWRFAIRTT